MFRLIPLCLALVVVACGSDGSPVQSGSDLGRSSGDLAQESAGGDSDGGDSDSGDSDPEGPTATTATSAQAPAIDDTAGSEPGTSDAPSTTVGAPEIRPDGLELVFADGALGPARLGSTIEEIGAALGPAYDIQPEENIRVDFPSGYSISRDGTVLFWAIEEAGKITVFMSGNPRVGLDGGLRPGLTLAQAIELHGEPTLRLGTEIREFASFADGVGTGPVSVLVAIGQFGGPVGTYAELEAGAEASGYTLEDANIKELWFWAQP